MHSLDGKNLKKTPHSITLQCVGRGLGHLAAHIKDVKKKWEPNQNFENSANFDENFQI